MRPIFACAGPSHGLNRLNTLLRRAPLQRSTPYAGLMMLLALQDFRRNLFRHGVPSAPDGRGARAHV
ncbi:hypothetical protein GCU68_00225 [Natronorubrum aibiense]|uniref:Uncharacterized protein n=1 Tax=Natronorubrum aibiense TaxID=348826 RepID=A0A5P9P7H7_9EURY|nr:hypothetical protein GCU68_00225 [Natronorubrum aibiense]